MNAMNVPRKPPSVSPPVQVPFPAQHLGQQPQYHFAPQVPGNQEDLSQGRTIIYPQPQHIHQVKIPQGGFAQQAGPHDMNKQSMAAHVPAGPGQSNQQTMQTQMMYQNSQQPPPRANAPSFIQPRQSVPQNIRGTGQPRPVNIATSPGQPMYNQQPIQTMYTVQGQPFMQGGQPAVHIIQQGPPPPMQVPGYPSARPSMQAPPQFTITTSQPGTMNITNAAPFNFYPTAVTAPPPQQNSAIYYSTPGGLAMQAQAAQVRQITPQPYQKRERKALKITDPTTGEEVNVGAGKTSTPPQSGPPSSRATPVTTNVTPPPQAQPQQQTTREIAAQFAAQVAATLKQGGQPYGVPPPAAVQQSQADASGTQISQANVAPPTAVSAEMASSESLATGDSSDVKNEPSEREKESKTDVDEAASVDVAKATASLADLDLSDSSKTDDKGAGAGEAKVPVEKKADAQKRESPEVSPEPEQQPNVEVVSEASTVVKTVPPQKSKDSTPEPVSHDTVQDPVPPTTAISHLPAESSPAESERVGAAGDRSSVERVKETSPKRSASRECSPAVADVKTPNAEVDEPVTKSENGLQDSDDNGKDGRGKKSRKQKMRELNQKGDNKEGSDMDAFSVDKNGSGAKPAEANNAVVAQEADAEVEEMEVSSPQEEQAPSTNEEAVPQPETVEKKVDDKVAEENKKNEQNTEDANKESNAKIENEAKPVISNDKMELKYKYREDQWSPLNPEGKKHYDRNFLLQVRFSDESMQKPAGLQIPDILLDSPLVRQDPTSMSGPGQMRGGPMQSGLRPGSMIDFTPGFIKASPAGKGHHGGGNMGSRSRSQQKDKQPRKVISVSIQQDVRLHTSENAWKPGGSKGEKEVKDDPEAIVTAEVLKKVRSILNKLTPQKFETLMAQILQLEINTEERLKGTIDLIFEKAIDEPGFSVAYANMCKCMIHLKVPGQDKPADMVTFRKLLLNRCQREFEKDKTQEVDFANMHKEIEKAGSEEEKKRLTENLEMLETKARRRSLGNIRFIGELFKLKMLTEGIMHDCLLKLLRSNDEDSLECLCRLVTTVGKELDHQKAKLRMDQYFQQMEKIIKQRKTSSRVRFMLQDVIELRHKLRWVPRREDNNPKTIDQIHKEIAQEAIQKNQFVQQFTMQQQQQQQQARKSSGRGRPGGPPNQQQQDDGWNTVGKTTRALDPGRTKLTKQTVDDNIQLGPGGRPGFGAWGRGSSGGGKSGSQENERPSTPGNRFQALSAGRAPSAEGQYEGTRSGSGSRGMSAGRDKGRNTPTSTPGRGASGKSYARMSQEQDREAALNAVRTMMGPGGKRTPSGSRNASRDSSRNRQQSRERNAPGEFKEPAPPPPISEMSEADIEKKTKAIMEEYIHLQDMKEALQCVRELNSPNKLFRFVETAINQVLERSTQARKQTGLLLHNLVSKKLMSQEAYIKGLKEVLEFAEDMAIDIPKIYLYLGELISPMIEDGSIPLSFIKTAFEPLVRCNKAGHLAAEVLHDASNRLGHLKVGDLWKASDLQWSDFLSADENVDEFIKNNKLEFTLVEEHRSTDTKSMPIEKVQEELDRLIVNQDTNNENLFDWIEANVGETKSREPEFIRALMTSVCNSAITGTGAQTYKLDSSKLQHSRALLLQKYLDHQAELELQALFALQALVHKLDHPPVLLRDFFDVLYDEDVISEDAFYQWEQSSDQAEQAGKGVARTSVVQFFAWLREADEESQDDN